MLPALLRTGALIVFWRRYLRQRIKGLLLATAATALVILGHSEALAYFKATGKTAFNAWAFYFRWTGWAIVAVVYYVKVERPLIRTQSKSNETTVRSDATMNKPSEDYDPVGDPSIVVRTRAEQIIERKRNERTNKDR